MFAIETADRNSICCSYFLGFSPRLIFGLFYFYYLKTSIIIDDTNYNYFVIPSLYAKYSHIRVKIMPLVRRLHPSSLPIEFHILVVWVVLQFVVLFFKILLLLLSL